MIITLNDPGARNALGSPMFDALECALAECQSRSRIGEVNIVVIRATGSAFCSGFDLGAGVDDPRALESFVRRLAGATRMIRSMGAIWVAQVQGSALAGGCAVVAACDIVCASEGASFGYPVHRIGISPAVSLPMLMASVGCGPARTLALSGDVIDARRALGLGLVHRLASDAAELQHVVDTLVASLEAKGPTALRETKRWLNRLDGTDPGGPLGSQLGAATDVSAQLCMGDESRRLLHEFWQRKARG